MDQSVKVAIGTLARDSEFNIVKYSKFLDQLRTVIDFDSFVFENDSVDNTKILLDKIADYKISENLGINKFEGSPATLERASFMSQIRNRLKHLIFNTDDYDVVIFTDIDLVSWPNVDRIKLNIEDCYNARFGAVTSNGLSFYNNSIIYYDIWSLVIDNKIQNHKIWLKSDISSRNVDSAFGGLAIYNGAAIKDINYEPIFLDGYPCPWHPPNRIACEHCSLNRKLRNKGYEIIIDEGQVVYR